MFHFIQFYQFIQLYRGQYLFTQNAIRAHSESDFCYEQKIHQF